MRVHGQDGADTWIRTSIVVLPEVSEDEGGATIVHFFRLADKGTLECPPLRIHLLGRVIVERADGSRVDSRLWRRTKVRALLGLLALQRGRPLHRDVLIQTLWPDLEYAAALHNLNSTVYRLRRSLEPDLGEGSESRYIRYEADHYDLEGGRTHWVDVDAFRGGLSQARQEPDPVRAITAYRRALALYRGELLAGLREEGQWLHAERERFAEHYLSGLEEVGTLLAQQGRYAEAADQYLQALALDPCREMVAQRLMRLALRRGDRAAAARHYRRLEDTLWSELEMLPSEETTLLYEEAQRGG
jgi:DNA-binding SARP family transcriptional activator